MLLGLSEHGGRQIRRWISERPRGAEVQEVVRRIGLSGRAVARVTAS
jgi:hypothetical protein